MKSHIVVLFVLIECARSLLNETIETSRVLSRRKRFLVFPEGSSFQLVFCVQTSALIQIGDIFLVGNTAALAWDLPTDPKLFHMLKDQTRGPLRRGDQKQEKNIIYLDEQGKVIAKVPYKRKPLVNPVFAKRSIDNQLSYREKLKQKIDRTKMHEHQLKKDYLQKKEVDRNSIEFHRNSRLSLFKKIESLFSASADLIGKILRAFCPFNYETADLAVTTKAWTSACPGEDFPENLKSQRAMTFFYTAVWVLTNVPGYWQWVQKKPASGWTLTLSQYWLGQDGRQCVLHKLCKAGQPYREQGTFLQEALRTIFTLPKGFAEEEEYDKAHTAKECDTLYPGCEYLQDPDF